MIYRQSGQFKTNYADDMAMFPMAQDRWGMVALLVVAALVVPLVASHYWLSSLLIPFLIFSLAALGLNLLTGYAGQLSLGHAGFMGVGRMRRTIWRQAFRACRSSAVFLVPG